MLLKSNFKISDCAIILLLMPNIPTFALSMILFVPDQGVCVIMYAFNGLFKLTVRVRWFKSCYLTLNLIYLFYPKRFEKTKQTIFSLICKL